MAGDVGFDPLGLSNIDDVGIDLYWLREAELKHCRLAMLAVAGIVQVEVFGPAPGCEAATAETSWMPSGNCGTPTHNTLRSVLS
jgi:light-harvesting complex I chlorophyll a/b binding protein 1